MQYDDDEGQGRRESAAVVLCELLMSCEDLREARTTTHAAPIAEVCLESNVMVFEAFMAMMLPTRSKQSIRSRREREREELRVSTTYTSVVKDD